MLTAEQLEELRGFDTPTVWNALEAMRIRPNTSGFSHPGLRLRTPGDRPMVGYAATAKVSGWTGPTADQKGLMFDFFSDVLATRSPSIAVVEDIDERPIGSFWGEVQATTFLALGAVGTLTQGGVRDLREVAELGFHFFSTEIMVARAESHIVDHGCPVTISGMEVIPSDLIHADIHGAVVIPPEAASELARACRKVAEAELSVLEPARRAIAVGVKPRVDELREWRAEMAARRALD
jgi:regulator of RNase E activity RraA